MTNLPVPQGTSGEPPSPFAGSQPPRSRSFAERLLRRPTPALAKQALAALFAAESPHQVSESRVAAILTEHRALGQHAREVANALYRRALERFLHDHALTDVELAYLERLVRVLHIGFDHAERLTLELTKPIYEMAVREAAADHQVTEEEKASLTQMVERLRLPPALAFQIANPILGGVVQDRFNEMIADRRFSPEEFAELESLARSMSVELTMDTGTQNQLRYFAQLWQIEQGELPTLDPPIALQKAEVCHFHVAAEWHELRTRVQRIGYHGPVLSIPIVRGLRYRVGGITPAVVRSEELTQIDEGDLYFTSKRVLFNGARRNTTIRLSNLIGFQVFADGLALEKSSGRSPYFLFAQDTELAATVLSVLLANAGR